MRIDTSKPYQVRDVETNLSTKSFATEAEANDYAKFLTDYHGREHKVVKWQ